MIELIDNLRRLKQPRVGAAPTIFDQHEKVCAELEILLNLRNSGCRKLPGQPLDISFHIQDCNRRLRHTSGRIGFLHQQKSALQKRSPNTIAPR